MPSEKQVLDEWLHTWDVLFELGAIDEERDNPSAARIWHEGAKVMFEAPEKALAYFDLAKSGALRQFSLRHAG